jgi:hypothetical protein
MAKILSTRKSYPVAKNGGTVSLIHIGKNYLEAAEIGLIKGQTQSPT